MENNQNLIVPTLSVLHHGGGVQTGTIVEMIAVGVLPKPDVVISADTGDEPAYIYRQWERDRQLLDTVGVPFFIVKNGNMIEDLYSGGRFAAMPFFTRQKIERNGFGKSATFFQHGKMRRQCTSEYKIVPIERKIREILLERGLATRRKTDAIVVKKNVLVESWIGYTLDEVERVGRMRASPWQTFRFPLLEMRMTKSDCVRWLEENGKPARLSSACKKCPLISNAQRRQIRDNDPDGWAETLKFDADLRSVPLRIAKTANGELFLSDKLIPLAEVDIDESENQLTLFSCSQWNCAT